MFRTSVMDQHDTENIYSSNIESGEWIQPSISIEIIEPSRKPRIGEVYSIYLIDKGTIVIDSDLLEEIQEWELASDFDFQSFEDSIRD